MFTPGFRPWLKKGRRLLKLSNSWFSVTWWDGHVGAQNNGKMSLKFCIITESNSQKTFFAIVLYTNMAAVTSRENREYEQLYLVASCSQFPFLVSFSCHFFYLSGNLEPNETPSQFCYSVLKAIWKFGYLSFLSVGITHFLSHCIKLL